MAILRKNKKEKYTVIDNSVFYDYSLSYKAKGLLCQMLSLPDGWSFSIEGLARLSSDGKSSVQSALNELKDAGYFYRKQLRDGNRIKGIEYIISEVKFTDFQVAENQDIENQDIENQSQLNTKELNTKKSNTKDIYSGLPDELKSAIKDFEDMRKRIKAPLSDRARQMLLVKLDKLAGDDTQKKVAILEQSIFNSWKGVFELTNGYSGSNKQRYGVSGKVRTPESRTSGRRTRLPDMASEICGSIGSEDNA